MSAELLARSAPANGNVQLERIRAAVTNMSTLIDDLLALAQVNESALEPELIDVTGMAWEIAAELQSGSTEHITTITNEPEQHNTADRGLLRIALSNLLGNAW